MRVELHPSAEDDLFEGAAWYEDREFDLGVTFYDDVTRWIDTIAESPAMWPVVPGSKSTPPIAVKTRFYIDPELGEPHIARHDVTEQEAQDVLLQPLEDRAGREGSRVALGQTQAGRYLRVIYVVDPDPDSVFVITAYELGPKAKRALRRRRRKS